MISTALNFFDISIIIFFIALFMLWPKFFTTSGSGDSEFLLMSKSLSLPLFVATLTSTWYGGIFGVTQIAFLNGIYGFFTQGLFWYISYFIFAIFLAKKIRQQQVLSLPELIGQKFGQSSRKIAAIILFFHALPITYAISVGLLIKLIFGISFFWAIIIGVLIVAFYTSLGGFKGVVFTDCLQFILMFLAVIMLLLTCYFKFGGLDFLSSRLPANYFLWRGEHSFSSAIIWLFIACTSTFIHPVFYQRCLAAKSDSVAIKGILITMLMWFIFDMCTCFGGMYAKAIIPDADSATAYLVLGTKVLPHGIRGLFLCGVLATILSTLDSFMFVSGTSISYDLLKPRSGSNHHKLAIFLSALLVIFLGLALGNNFEENWLLMEGAFSSSMLLPVFAATYLKRSLFERHFILPACSSLAVFIVSSILHKNSPLIIAPFYLAHLTAMIFFVVSLNIKSQSQTPKAFFNMSKILLKNRINRKDWRINS